MRGVIAMYLLGLRGDKRCLTLERVRGLEVWRC